MGESSIVKSISYPQRPHLEDDEEGWGSIGSDVEAAPAPKPEIDLSSLPPLPSTKLDYCPTEASVTDGYGKLPQLPLHLKPSTTLRISTNAEPRDTTLGDLVQEAKTNPQAQQELLRIARAKALADAELKGLQINAACYEPSEENLLEILAQLVAEDEKIREEGASSLTATLKNGAIDQELKAGVLAAVDRISTSNPQAQAVIIAVYRDACRRNSKFAQRIEKLANSGNYLRGLHLPKNTELLVRHTQPSTSADASNSRSTALLTQGSASPEEKRQSDSPLTWSSDFAAGTMPASSSALAPILPQNALSNTAVRQIVQRVVQVTTDTVLNGLSAGGILEFLGKTPLSTNPGDPSLRRCILALALPLPTFTGSLFDKANAVAITLAQSIQSIVAADNRASAGRSLSLAARETFSFDDFDTPDTSENDIKAGASNLSLEALPALRGALAASPNSSAVSSKDFGSFPPSLLTTLSGLQAGAYQQRIGPSFLAHSAAYDFSSRPNYFVEGPGPLDEDGHQGGGGHAQDGSDSEQGRGNKREDRAANADA
ncbi:MAG TPA: hypothetical protein DF383_13085 [Deltaproteobacteria bacterium]|nr:hypothetical protein [Deltaproteobacteria bacterium]